MSGKRGRGVKEGNKVKECMQGINYILQVN